MKKGQKLIASACALILGTVAVNAQADTNRYIVQFKDDGARGGNRALAGAGADIKLSLSQANAVAVEIPEQALRGLRNNPNIEYIEIDPKRYPASLRDSEHLTYGIPAVQADLVTYQGDADGKRIFLPSVATTRVLLASYPLMMLTYTLCAYLTTPEISHMPLAWLALLLTVKQSALLS